MCGIIGQFKKDENSIQLVKNGVKLLNHRGPDASGVITDTDIIFGHTRLSIIDVSKRSNQPFKYKNVLLTFNGEIWNYKQLKKELQIEGLVFKTESDTEVVAAILYFYGSEGLKRLQGMFALAWKVIGEDKFFIARDCFGEIPVHFLPKFPYPFCSELKVLNQLGYQVGNCINVPSGSFIEARNTCYEIKQYYTIPTNQLAEKKCSEKLFSLLKKSVDERVISDVPICTLLSGGIDSSTICYLLSKKVKNIVAYTAVFNKKSKDLSYARNFAKEHNIELREVEIPMPIKERLEKIVQIIEEPHKAQVEIGYICYYLAKQIKSDGFKVVFSGEGSDELFASYAFSYYALKDQDFHEYRKKLFLDQERKNFNRINKVFMHFGVESRLPFLNKDLVEFILSLPIDIVRKEKNLKYILSMAFLGKINDEILFRQKVAFQDGIDIKETIQNLFGGKQQAISFYRSIFASLYSKKIKGLGVCQ